SGARRSRRSPARPRHSPRARPAARCSDVTAGASPRLQGMPEFGGLLIVVAVAFAAPFLLGLFPGVRLPSVVLEIVAGIVIGPAVLGIVHVDQSIAVISLIGLAFLLFLAGLEIELDKLRGQVLRLTAGGFVL